MPGSYRNQDQHGQGRDGATRSMMTGLWENLFHRAVSHLRVGRLAILFPDGKRHAVEGAEPGPEAELEIRDMRGLQRLMRGGDMGFAEAYMAGEVDSPDLTDLIELAARNESALAQALSGRRLIRVWNRLSLSTSGLCARSIRQFRSNWKPLSTRLCSITPRTASRALIR